MWLWEGRTIKCFCTTAPVRASWEPCWVPMHPSNPHSICGPRSPKKERKGQEPRSCFALVPQQHGERGEVSLARLPMCAEFGPPTVPWSPGRRRYGSQLWPQLCTGRRNLALLPGGCQTGCWRGSCFAAACRGVPV